tara:strand:+ start:3021 stop:3311 length:291 start_codon:yes stop_codon:yes gene_type:complete
MSAESLEDLFMVAEGRTFANMEEYLMHINATLMDELAATTACLESAEYELGRLIGSYDLLQSLHEGEVALNANAVASLYKMIEQLEGVHPLLNKEE